MADEDDEEDEPIVRGKKRPLGRSGKGEANVKKTGGKGAVAIERQRRGAAPAPKRGKKGGREVEIEYEEEREDVRQRV